MLVERFGKVQPRGDTPTAQEFVELGLRLERLLDAYRSILVDLAAPRYFQVGLSASVSFTSGSPATVVWNTAIDDAGLLVDKSTGIFTAPSAGLWIFVVGLRWGALGDQSFGFGRIMHNGAQVGRVQDSVSTATSFNLRQQVASPPLLLSKNDTILVSAQQTSGGPISLDSSSTDTWFAGFEIGRRR